MKRKEPVRLTYDPKHNIAYLRLREKTEPVETIRVSEGLNIDLAPNGTVHGIEFLDANNQFQATHGSRLALIDEKGTQQTPPLPR